jgi:hypothetical protein
LTRRVVLGVVKQAKLAIDQPSLLANPEAELALNLKRPVLIGPVVEGGAEANAGDDVERARRAFVLRGHD